MNTNEVTLVAPRVPACQHQGHPSQGEFPLNIFTCSRPGAISLRSQAGASWTPHVTTKPAEQERGGTFRVLEKACGRHFLARWGDLELGF